MNLKINEWKEFKISDYFEVILSAGDLKIDDCDPGEVPLVSSGASNNGVVGYIDKAGDGKAQIFKANSITVDMFCNAFYQDRDFYAVSHGRVNILYPKFNMTPYAGMFVSSIIKKEQYKFSYGRAVYSSEIGRMKIKLPSTDLGDPDWAFMESYIKSLNYEPVSTTKKNTAQALNIGLWQEFSVGDIFEIYNGKFITKEEIDENPGDFCAVQSGEENNGILGKINKQYCIDNGYTYTEQPCLTVARSGSAGYVSYQNFGCVVGDSAKILLLKDSSWRTPYVYLFLKTLLMANKFKYTYGRKVTEDKYLNETIRLPVKMTQEGKCLVDVEKKYSQNGFIPDFEFMESYTKSLPYGDRI